MSGDIEIVFPARQRSRPFAALLEELSGGAQRSFRTDYSERLAALHDLSEAIVAPNSPLRREQNVAGLPFLAGFLRRENLERLVARELPVPGSLSAFVSISDRKSLRLVPKGLVGHWIAGNVPLLGMFSWAVSTLLGNRNIIRLSSRTADVVSPLMQLFAGTSSTAQAIADETLVVCFDRENRAAHTAMSQAADVRIAWGAQEAVEAIRALPSRWQCEDIVFGPRMSMAVVDPAELTPAMLERLTTDIVFFDQMACSSPQHLYVKQQVGDEAPTAGFVDALASALKRQTKTFRRHELDFSETYQIVLDRTRVLLSGGSLQRDATTQWTTAVLETPLSEVVCTNRFLQIIPFSTFDDLYRWIPRNVQTIVLALNPRDAAEFSEEAANRGVCRFPRPGEGNHFDNPWDGVPLVSRLTRSVLRSDAPN